MDEARIHAEYQRLGYTHGWSFANVPIRLLDTAKTVFVGLNPGGSDDEHNHDHCNWDFPAGNAYLDERYDPENDSLSPLQIQIASLHDLFSYGREDVFAAQFIPFRSQSIKTLPKYDDAIRFSKEIWRWVVSRSPAKLYFCIGWEPERYIPELLSAVFEKEFDSGWGNTKIIRYVSADGKVVVRLPHLSRYQLFSMLNPSKVAQARYAILTAARPVGTEPLSPPGM